MIQRLGPRVLPFSNIVICTLWCISLCTILVPSLNYTSLLFAEIFFIMCIWHHNVKTSWHHQSSHLHNTKSWIHVSLKDTTKGKTPFCSILKGLWNELNSLVFHAKDTFSGLLRKQLSFFFQFSEILKGDLAGISCQILVSLSNSIFFPLFQAFKRIQSKKLEKSFSVKKAGLRSGRSCHILEISRKFQTLTES